jgi:5-methyltetrahydrofolate--homocysteine methyltransferase
MAAYDVSALLKERCLIMDGAMGTMLQKHGMQPGMCPELFAIQNEALLENIHYQYIQAGADIIETFSFGANYYKLQAYGLEERVAELNQEAVRLARQASGGKALVAACVGPTGQLLKPMGTVDFDDLLRVFSEQITACDKAGADLICIETMTDIGELRAAVIAAQSCSKLPIIAHMSFENGGRTMMGTDAATALFILEALNPLAIGANCSGGAKEMLPVIETMGRLSDIYLSVEPNAGLPMFTNGNTVFPDSPEEMAEQALRLRQAGANIIGGCCGTTPEHIQAMAAALRGMGPVKRTSARLRALASRSRAVLIGDSQDLAFIGERINPTARKKLAADIKAGQMNMVVEEARLQVESGAPILDVNMGVPGIDEAEAMTRAVTEIQAAVDRPISIDSTRPEAIEAGLKNYVGRPLINSTTAEDKQLDVILPLAKKYGAAVLGLCLDEKGIPPRSEDRLKLAGKIYQRAKSYGLRDQDIYIDCLVTTAGAEQARVLETLITMQKVKQELKVGTVLGVSNVSHGLPQREVLTSTFLAMAWAAGLDLPIMNPFDGRVRDVTRAAAVLLNRDVGASLYIEHFQNKPTPGKSAVRHQLCHSCNIPELLNASALAPEKAAAAAPPSQEGLSRLGRAVLEGDQHNIIALLEEILPGRDPLALVNQDLIPGIEEAGLRYDQKVYFLPQLMMSAETMKKAFGYLKPLLREEALAPRGTVVLATVEGDIHDIGKNIVGIMLENYGFEVVDLGKDVSAATILHEAERRQANIIGLSALMTTTMPRMAEVIEGVRNRGLSCKVMVGGAVLTQEYADLIGADGFAADARKAITVATGLVDIK